MAMNASMAAPELSTMAFSFHHISVRNRFSSRESGPESSPESSPESDFASEDHDETESQEPKKKSVYVRKEFPETWLWTEEMVK